MASSSHCDPHVVEPPTVGKGEVIDKSRERGRIERFGPGYAGVVSEATGQQGSGAGKRLVRNLALYTLARLGLVVLIAGAIIGVAALIGVEVPIIVAALFALLVAMPLSLTLFKSLRTKVNEDIAVVDARRRQDKAQLRARLRGDDDGASA